jgi:hypothetical protein
MESMAALAWNRWQLWRGIGGRIRLESVAALAWNTHLDPVKNPYKRFSEENVLGGVGFAFVTS